MTIEETEHRATVPKRSVAGASSSAGQNTNTRFAVQQMDGTPQCRR